MRQMLMLSGAIVVLTGFARDPGGCGDGDRSTGAINAPCTRSRDCKEGLACMNGVCVGPDAGSDRDASFDASDSSTDGSDDG